MRDETGENKPSRPVFVEGELEAITPPQAIEHVGLYFVTVTSRGTAGRHAHPAHLKVRFRD